MITKSVAAPPPEQQPLPGVATKEEVNLPPAQLGEDDLKRACKSLQKARLAVEAARDELRDIVASGCAAPVTLEIAGEYLEVAAGKVEDAQGVTRGDKAFQESVRRRVKQRLDEQEAERQLRDDEAKARAAAARK
jgi:hypothetical protein